MEQGRAEVELTIQIGAEDEAEALAILKIEAARMALRLLGKPPKSERVEERQWCAGAMRVTLNRPHLAEAPSPPPLHPEEPSP